METNPTHVPANPMADVSAALTFRKNPLGFRRATTTLIDAIATGDVEGATVLDVGARINGNRRKLYARGVSAVTHVDASKRRLDGLRAGAQRKGYPDRFVLGDFPDLAHKLQSADLVTLDRVVWAYKDVREVVSAAAARARKRIGFVLPRDAWWVRGLIRLENLGLKVARRTSRRFAHRLADIHAQIRRNGFRRIHQKRTLFWQVDVYERAPWGGV